MAIAVANGFEQSEMTIRTDLRNAGVDRVDREVVVDNSLVTSRKPDDIPAFNRRMIEEFSSGRREERPAV